MSHPKREPQPSGDSSSLEEEVFLELQRSAEALAVRVSELFRGEQLSASQYNVLRILRGAGKGLSCRQIAERMVSRDPDMTRLLDALDGRGLVSRARSSLDRRVIEVRLAPAGRALLERLDAPVQGLHRRQLGALGDAGLEQLRGLLVEVRKVLSD